VETKVPKEGEIYYVDASEVGFDHSFKVGEDGALYISASQRTPEEEAAFRAGMIDQLIEDHNDFCRRHGLPERKQESWRDRAPLL
jgi:hypothetical protein